MPPPPSATTSRLNVAGVTRGVVISIVTVALATATGVHAQAPLTNTQPEPADNYYAAGNRIDITAPIAADRVGAVSVSRLLTRALADDGVRVDGDH